MRAATAALLAVTTVLAFGAANATAKPVQSGVGVYAIGTLGSTAVALGIVESSNRKCLPNRKVKFIVKTSGSAKLLDVARSGANGGWDARADVDEVIGATAIVFKMAPRKVKTKHGNVKCSGDTGSPL